MPRNGKPSARTKLFAALDSGEIEAPSPFAPDVRDVVQELAALCDCAVRTANRYLQEYWVANGQRGRRNGGAHHKNAADCVRVRTPDRLFDGYFTPGEVVWMIVDGWLPTATEVEYLELGYRAVKYPNGLMRLTDGAWLHVNGDGVGQWRPEPPPVMETVEGI